MATATTICQDALKEIGVLSEGDTPTTEMLDDAYRELNRLMEIMSNVQAFAYKPVESSLALTGQTSFTVGPSGADVTANRPISIESAFVTLGTLDYPVEILNNQQWDDIVFKTATGSVTEAIWYEPLMTNGKVHVWPVCTGCTLNLRTVELVDTFATVTTALSMPPGYEMYLVKQLAVNISPQYPACTLSPITVKTAQNAYKMLSRVNNVIPKLSLPTAVLSSRKSNRLAAIKGGY